MSDNLPFPGETEEEFQRRRGRAGGGAIFALQGPNANLKGNEEAVAAEMGRRLQNPGMSFLDIPVALGSQLPNVPDIGGGVDLNERGQQAADAIGNFTGDLTNPENHFFDLPRAIGRFSQEVGEGVPVRAREFAEGVIERGAIPQAARTIDDIIQTGTDFVHPINQALFLGFGDQSEQGGEQSRAESSLPFSGTGGIGAGGGGGAGGGASTRGGPNDPFTREFNLPLPADEILSNEEPPVLSKEAVDEFVGRLEDSGPDDFERADPRANDLLAAAGASLAQAGRAPTFGQALLAAGTGASGALSEHQARQDALARENQAQQNAVDRQVAQAAFQGEQALTQSERQAMQQAFQREQFRAQQNQRRNDIINQASQVDVSGDNIILSRPTVNDNGTMTVETEVINTEQQHSMLDQIATGRGLDEIELPDVGGRSLNKLINLAPNPTQRLSLFTSGQLVAKTLTPDKIQGSYEIDSDGDGEPDATLTGPEMFQQIDRQSQDQLAQLVGLEAGSTMSEIGPLYDSAFPNSDFGAEDARERLLLDNLVKVMSQRPDFRNGAMQGAGFIGGQ